MESHRVTAENAQKVWGWFQARGGVSVWQSANLSNPGASWTVPIRNEDGSVAGRPTWEAEQQPARTITDPAEVVVDVPVEVRRLRVAIRRSSNGLSFKLTNVATRRVRAAVARAGDGAWYTFDHATQEAVVWRTGESVPLAEFIGVVAAE